MGTWQPARRTRQDALGSLDTARNHAAKGQYADAWDEWVDACNSMDGSRTLEPTGPGSEYRRALDEAADLLHKCGKEMREAKAATDKDNEAYEREVERFRAMIREVQGIVGT